MLTAPGVVDNEPAWPFRLSLCPRSVYLLFLCIGVAFLCMDIVIHFFIYLFSPDAILARNAA